MVVVAKSDRSIQIEASSGKSFTVLGVTFEQIRLSVYPPVIRLRERVGPVLTALRARAIGRVPIDGGQFDGTFMDLAIVTGEHFRDAVEMVANSIHSDRLEPLKAAAIQSFDRKYASLMQESGRFAALARDSLLNKIEGSAVHLALETIVVTSSLHLDILARRYMAR